MIIVFAILILIESIFLFQLIRFKYRVENTIDAVTIQPNLLQPGTLIVTDQIRNAMTGNSVLTSQEISDALYEQQNDFYLRNLEDFGQVLSGKISCIYVAGEEIVAMRVGDVAALFEDLGAKKASEFLRDTERGMSLAA